MKKLNLIFIFLFISILYSINVFGTVILSDNFDIPIDSLIYEFSNGSAMRYNVSDGYLKIEGNTTALTTPAFVQTLYQSTTNESFITSIKIKSGGFTIGSNDHLAFMVSNWDYATSFISAPPEACGIIFEANNGNYRLLRNYPTAQQIKVLEAIDSDTHTLRIDTTKVTAPAIYTLYEVYWDGNLEHTENQSDTCNAPALNVTFAGYSTNNEYKQILFDDLEIDGVITARSIGAGCSVGSDCDSGKCCYGFCCLKGVNEPCESNGECLTGVCSNGKCTKPDILTSLEASKNELFGAGENVSNFISLFIILGGVILIIGSTLNLAGGVLGLGWLFMSSIFFLIIGWLSPLFVLGLVLILLIIIVLFWVIGSGG